MTNTNNNSSATMDIFGNVIMNQPSGAAPASVSPAIKCAPQNQWSAASFAPQISAPGLNQTAPSLNQKATPSIGGPAFGQNFPEIIGWICGCAAGYFGGKFLVDFLFNLF